MKRNLCKYFAFCQYIDVDQRSEVNVPDYVMSDSDLQNVLNEIFSVDPDTGFPRGDIAYFLSKDGNPQVKAWLESNLLSPRAKQTGTSLDGVTDDFIAEYARNDGESVADYALRLRGYYDSAQAEIDKLNSKSE